MLNPQFDTVIEQARSNLPKIAVLGTVFLAMGRLGFKVESRDDSFGMIKARPNEGIWNFGSLVVRAWESPPGSEIEFLLEVPAGGDKTVARLFLREFISKVQPLIRGFQLVEGTEFDAFPEEAEPEQFQHQESVFETIGNIGGLLRSSWPGERTERQRTTVTTQRTGKEWKALRAISWGIFFLSILTAIGGKSEMAATLFFIAMAGGLAASLGAWWHHG